MSGHNANLTLPLGDRDDAPAFSPNASLAEPVAERDAQAADGGLLPGLTLVLDELDRTINDELPLAFAELSHARNHDQLAVFKAATHRLASLASHVARTVKNYRAGEDELQQKE
jgi:hypothetical protein